LVLYVLASSKKLRLQQAVRLDDGGWEMRDAPQELEPNQPTVLVVQGLDFFAEVPALEDQMPAARRASKSVVVLVVRDMHNISSTGIKWIERYAKELKAHDSLLVVADVNAEVLNALKKAGAMDVIGAENVIPATARVLDAENQAWEVAQNWLQMRAATG
jgi:SulP family sulfate permease